MERRPPWYGVTLRIDDMREFFRNQTAIRDRAAAAVV
jgi:hypothetical protein